VETNLADVCANESSVIVALIICVGKWTRIPGSILLRDGLNTTTAAAVLRYMNIPPNSKFILSSSIGFTSPILPTSSEPDPIISCSTNLPTPYAIAQMMNRRQTTTPIIPRTNIDTAAVIARSNPYPSSAESPITRSKMTCARGHRSPTRHITKT
jgi:hypothetical protein